jgi:hypothetical protein
MTEEAIVKTARRNRVLLVLLFIEERRVGDWEEARRLKGDIVVLETLRDDILRSGLDLSQCEGL